MRVNYARMLQERLDGVHGLAPPRLDALVRRFPEVHGELLARRTEGEYGFYHLPEASDTVAAIRRFSEGLGQAHEDVLVLGIGGSALGTRALLDAIRGRDWNQRSDEAREYFPRVTVLDNVDPAAIGAALQRLDPRRTLVNVISKSGNTAETLAQYLVVRAWLREALGDGASRHLVFTTDPESGALREMATTAGVASLEVPPAIGGRFSVLSPVGLLPLALAGIEIDELLGGAGEAVRRAESDDLRENPAALYAALMFAADTQLGARIQVLMPYCDGLREFTAWYCQLWAESLGKAHDRRGQLIHAGPTPLGAVGATDQHSLVQLFMEGPFDKVVAFVSVDDLGPDLPIPSDPSLPEAAAFLGGHTLGELLHTEYEATSAALAKAGRMNLTVRIRDLSARSLGELVMFFQIAVGYAGVWYGVNPFDQPGVEFGKRLTYAALGRPGYQGETATPRPEPVREGV